MAVARRADHKRHGGGACGSAARGLALATALGLAGCARAASPLEPRAPGRAAGGGPAVAVDPLPSWNAGRARDAILRYVAQATDPASPAFVRPEDRVAVFDNDGTLWCERPLPVQAQFVLNTMRRRADQDPVLAREPAYRAARTGDLAYFTTLHTARLMAIALGVDEGTTQEQYAARAAGFLATERHPRFDVRYTALAYAPMLELLALLRARGFRTFVVTGGDSEFVRVFSEGLYGVRRDAVVGTDVAYALRDGAEQPELVRRAELVGPFNDGPGKPPNLQRQIGRRPVIAVGNSDGDLQMLEYAGDARPTLRLLVHHDDAVREYAYDRGAERALEAARARGWVVVSMREDFRRVFTEDVGARAASATPRPGARLTDLLPPANSGGRRSLAGGRSSLRRRPPEAPIRLPTDPHPPSTGYR